MTDCYLASVMCRPNERCHVRSQKEIWKWSVWLTRSLIRDDCERRSEKSMAVSGRGTIPATQVHQAEHLSNSRLHWLYVGGGCLWVCVCVCLSLFNERARKMNWPGSEKTALEWQARRSSRIRLKTDPCREHHTLTDTHTHTHNNTTSSHTLMIYIYIYSTM